MYGLFLGLLAGLAIINYTNAFGAVDWLGELFGILFALSVFLIALPATLLFISAWLKFFIAPFIPQKFSRHIGAVILIALIYVSCFTFVKAFVPLEEQAKALNFGFKLTVLIVIIALLWVFVYGATFWLAQLVAKTWYKISGKDVNEVLGMALYGAIFWLIYHAIRYLADHIPLVEWIFGKKFG